MSVLTIFTAPKPFVDPFISMIQKNALQSWKMLGEDVSIYILGDEPGIQEAGDELGIPVLNAIRKNSQGTPLISSMFEQVRQVSTTPLYMIINTDILLFPEMLDSIKKAQQQADRFLMVGQRWDLEVNQALNFSEGWESLLKEKTRNEGKLHSRGGSDYFVFPAECYQKVPDFAIGRAGWDNWMIYEARRRGWKVVDATADIQIVHQNHDYRHLPNGKPHYRLPETFENVRLAGGARTIFTLLDTDYELVQQKIAKPKWNFKKFWREVEIFPLVRLKSYALAQLFYAVFHPIKAYREVRTWMRDKQGAKGE